MKIIQKLIPNRINLSTVITSARPLISKTKIKHFEEELGINNIVPSPGKFIDSSLSTVYGNISKGLNITRIKNVSPHSLDYERMGFVKYLSIREYVLKKMTELVKAGFNDKQYKPIFIGDNGQGDLLAARALLDDNIINYAFIHNVDSSKYSGVTSEHFYDNRLFPFRQYSEVIDILNNLDPELNLTCTENDVCISNEHYERNVNYFNEQERLENYGEWENRYGDIDDVKCFPCIRTQQSNSSSLDIANMMEMLSL
tara:strand:- start:2219 stop:2986 length:768 start_codon:yes stop_codon:yes gene_type:complete